MGSSEVLDKIEKDKDKTKNGSEDILDLNENIGEMTMEVLDMLEKDKNKTMNELEEDPVDSDAKKAEMEVLDESVVEEELEKAEYSGGGHIPWVLIGLGL